MSLTYQIGITSADAVTIYPNYDMTGGKRQIRADHRSRSGKLRMYKWGDYGKWSIPVDYVSAADAAIVNSWFDTNTELLLFVTSDTETEVHSVYLTNDESPFKQYNKPYDDLYKGTLQLETY